MEAEKKTQTEKTTMKFRAKLILNFKIIVAAVVGCCLMAAPLTRAYKRNCEQSFCIGSQKAAPAEKQRYANKHTRQVRENENQEDSTTSVQKI